MRELPLFPLGLVQFPTLPLDLQVFEPRYLELLEDIAENSPQEFGVVAISSGHEVGEENLHGLAEVGCAVRIDTSRRAGPRVLVHAVGTWRFDSIEIVDRGAPYLTARVRPLPDDESLVEEEKQAGEKLRTALLAYADAAGIEMDTLPADPDELAWLIAAGGPLNRSAQLRVLAAPRMERLDFLSRTLRRESQLLRATMTLPFVGDHRFTAN